MDFRLFLTTAPSLDGLPLAFITLLEILFGLSLGALSIPSKTWSAHAFRLGIFSWLLPKLIDFSTNKSYTFKNRLADQTVFSLIGWNLLARLIIITFASYTSPSPRWIRPTSSELERLLKLRQEDIKHVLLNDPDALIPKEWELVPFPPMFSLDRLLYALDYLTLVRSGTSWFWPWQFRAFDWSLPAFKSSAAKRFGKPETSSKIALLHFSGYLAALAYYNHMIFPYAGVVTMAQMNILNQILLTFLAGGLISLSSAPLEALSFEFLITRKVVPPTALLANFNQPYLSSGVEEFWGRRWHHRMRRQLTSIASLFPLGRTKYGNAVWAFFVSGILHSFLIARAHPEPSLSRPLSYLPVFFDLGTVSFFVFQGVCMLIERKLVPQSFKRAWLWSTIIYSGRWYVDSILKSYLVR